MKFWFSWGVDDTNLSIKADIPHVNAIQHRVIAEKMRSINVALSEKGSASLHPSGLLADSLMAILKRCKQQGFQVWERKPPQFTGGSEYQIEVRDSPYLLQYYENITDKIT